MENLRSIDLNLLVILQVLLQEGSVSAAGRRIGLSQPATSHALARLRELFDDPLLLRRGTSMVPTARATALLGRLQPCLEELEGLFSDGPTFAPLTAKRKFRIASEDYFAYVLLPAVLRTMFVQAPSVDLDVVPLTPQTQEHLAQGELDLVIDAGTRSSTALDGIVLYRERLACLADPEHHGSRLSLDHFARAPQVVVAIGTPGPTFVDQVLEQAGLVRRVALRVSQFLAAPFAIKGTNLLFSCPERFARQIADVAGLRVLRLPKDLRRRFDYTMHWDRRSDSDPGHMWLRDLIAASATEKAV